jgi:cytidine deaminase
MKNVEIICHLTEYDHKAELNDDDKKLIEAAATSMAHAYAPYSGFHVGAAVRLSNGIIVKGNNQENASYPVGLCAERVAIFSASANHPGISVQSIAISARSNKFKVDKPVPPCGACRQAIAEFEHIYKQNIRIVMSGESGKILVAESIGILLPMQFTADDLNT